MTGTLTAISAALRTIHQPTGTIQCGARATLEVEHSGGGPGGSRSKSDKRLYCTLPNGHEEDTHRDGICCWKAHEFPDEIVDAREPRDLRRCTECGGSWPCATIQVLIREGV